MTSEFHFVSSGASFPPKHFWGEMLPPKASPIDFWILLSHCFEYFPFTVTWSVIAQDQLLNGKRTLLFLFMSFT